MIIKPVIVSHTKSELSQITGGIDSHINLDDILDVSGKKIKTEQREFTQKGVYGDHVVLQRGVFVINDVGNFLVSSEGNLPPQIETLLVSGSGNKNFRTITREKIGGILGSDTSQELFSLTEIHNEGRSTYGFIVKAILGSGTLRSYIGRTLTWKSPDEIEQTARITQMEKNLFYYLRATLGL